MNAYSQIAITSTLLPPGTGKLPAVTGKKGVAGNMNYVIKTIGYRALTGITGKTQTFFRKRIRDKEMKGEYIYIVFVILPVMPVTHTQVLVLIEKYGYRQRLFCR